MKIILEDFEAALRTFRKDPKVQAVLDKLFRYRLSIQRETSRLQYQEIHVIGMAHKLNPEGKAIITKDDVITSQHKVVEILEMIKPQIVGVEGFCGEKFTLHNAVVEAHKMWDMYCSYSEISRLVSKMENEPQQKQLWEFHHRHPEIAFCGVEDLDLLRLTNAVYKQRFDKQILTDPNFNTLLKGSTRLRGIIMVMKLGRTMKNRKLTRGALPVGLLHLQELGEYAKEFKCSWQFHNTTNLDTNGWF